MQFHQLCAINGTLMHNAGLYCDTKVCNFGIFNLIQFSF